MKKVLFFLAALCFGYWGATHKTELEKHWADLKGWFLNKEAVDEIAKERNGLLAEETAPEPETPPTPAAPSPTAQAPAPRTASTLDTGVYYTRERITQITDAGVKVINAGVKVEKVGEEQGQFLVDDGKQRVLTSLSKLTNDPMEVAAILQAAAPVPTGTTAKGKGLPPAAGGVSPDRELRRANEAKIRQYEAQILELTRQINGLTGQVNQLKADALQAKANGRPSTYNDRTIASLSQQITALEAQRSRLRVDAAAIPR